MTSTTNQIRLIHVVLPLGVITLGGLIAWYILTSGPKPQRVEPETIARLVEAGPLSFSQEAPSWRTGGVVTATERVMVMPRVSGQVKRVNESAVPGTYLTTGTLLAKLDDADYKLALKQGQASVMQANADLLIEQGQREIAREEYELARKQLPDNALSEENEALVLREPQIHAAKASLRSAQAALQQAELNVQRTSITMPFDGIVVSRNTGTGSQVNTGSTLFDVVRADSFWIEVTVPSAFLPFLDKNAVIELPDSGRHARFIKQLPEVNSTDRQIRLLLAVDDPLAVLNPEQPPLLLNQFVEVILPGQSIQDTYRIPSDKLVEGTYLWVVNSKKLHKRRVSIVYQGRENVWIKGGIQQDDQVAVEHSTGSNGRYCRSPVIRGA